MFIFVLIWASGLKTDSTMQCRMNRSAKIQPAKTGDFFEKSGYRFEIIDMDNNRVDKILVKKMIS